jgi:hypothetical protein
MNSGIRHGSWYVGGGGIRPACGDYCQTIGGAAGCGEGGHGSNGIKGAADGAHAWKCVGVAGGVAGLPCTRDKEDEDEDNEEGEGEDEDDIYLFYFPCTICLCCKIINSTFIVDSI